MRKRSVVLSTLFLLFVATNANACWLWWHHCRHHWIEHHYAHHHAHYGYAYAGTSSATSNGGSSKTDPVDDGGGSDATSPDGAELTSESAGEEAATFVSNITSVEELNELDGKIDNVSIGQDIKDIKDGQQAILDRLEALTKALAGE